MKKKLNISLMIAIAIVWVIGLQSAFANENLDFLGKELMNTESWEQIPGPYGGIIQSLAKHAQVLYAGTIGGSIYKSSDYGENWVFIGGNLPFLDIEKILYYDGRLFVTNRNYGIYFSDDEGMNWSELNTGLKNTQVTSIVELESNIFCSTYGGGVYMSTNKGESWFEKNFALPNKFINEMTLEGGGLYLATNQGIYVSGNNGETWGTLRASGAFMRVAVNGEYIFIGTNYQIMMTSNKGQDWDMASYGYGLGTGLLYSLYSTGPYVIAGRSEGVFVSTFIGGQWKNIYSKLKGVRVYALMSFDNSICAGTSKGVFFSQDYGGKWKESSKGMLNERVISLLIEDDIIYAGLQDNGVLMSNDFGETWKDLNLGWRRVSSLRKDELGLWVISNDTLLITSNSGISWEYRNFGLEGNKLHFLVKFKNDYYVGTDDGLYYSTNLGMSWVVRTDYLRKKKIRDFYVDKSGNIYLATADKVYLSRDNMVNWQTTYEGMKGSHDITRIRGNKDYVIAGSRPEVGFDAEIYLSYDEGRSWISTDFKYNKHYIHNIAVTGETAFVSVKSTDTAENIGVLYSSNSGKIWHLFNEGLTVKNIYDFAIYEKRVYAATYGQSLVLREIPEPLAKPVLLYPENNAKKIYAQTVLDWESVEGAEIYNVEIGDRLTNFNKHIIADYSSSISSLKVPAQVLKNQTTYYWRVNFIKNNRSSDWSDIYSFTTEAEQVTVSNLLLPEDGSEDVTVMTEFQWEQLSNVSEYSLQVATDIEFESVVLEEATATNSYKVVKGKFEFDTEYFWRVRATINGAEREWSEVFSFKTFSPEISSPQLVHPLDDAMDMPVTVFFEWESVDYADEYILMVSDNSQFTNIILNDTLNTTIFNVPAEVLDYETDYFWKVKAIFLDYESEWSEVRTFKTTIEVSVESDLMLTQIDFKMIPNPADKNVNLDIVIPFEDKIKIYLTDLQGKKIFEKEYYIFGNNANLNVNLPLEGFSSGNYFAVIETKYGIISKSLIIQK